MADCILCGTRLNPPSSSSNNINDFEQKLCIRCIRTIKNTPEKRKSEYKTNNKVLNTKHIFYTFNQRQTKNSKMFDEQLLSTALISPPKPYVKIIEQPLKNQFKHKDERKPINSDVHSTPNQKTYPTIEIFNYIGPIKVVVSCVTKNEPYRPHPNGLTGNSCRRDVCYININYTGGPIPFPNLNVQYVDKDGTERALKKRLELRIDPFSNGIESINLNHDLTAVRLCFQVFIEILKSIKPLRPIVSDAIEDEEHFRNLKNKSTKLISC